MKTKKKLLQILLIAILLLVLAVLGLCCLAVQPVNEDVFDAKPSDSLYTGFLKSALTGTEYSASQSEINSYLAHIIAQNEYTDDWELTGAYFDVSKKRVYARLTNGSVTLYITAKTDVSLEDDDYICFSLSDITIGDLPLPDKIVSFLFNRIYVGDPEEYIWSDPMEVLIPAHYGMNIDGYGEAVWIDVEDVSIEDGSVKITTNPIMFDSMEKFYEYAIENGTEWITGLFDE